MTTTWTRLLIPHDFSACAARALEVALELPSSGDHRDRRLIELLHVSQLPPNVPRNTLVNAAATPPITIAELTTRSARRELDAIAQPLRARGFDVRVIAVATVARDVATEILEIATRHGSDAIVMGTHGRAGLQHLLLGSVAEKVIRGSRIPVVTIRIGGGDGSSNTGKDESNATHEENIAADEEVG